MEAFRPSSPQHYIIPPPLQDRPMFLQPPTPALPQIMTDPFAIQQQQAVQQQHAVLANQHQALAVRHATLASQQQPMVMWPGPQQYLPTRTAPQPSGVSINHLAPLALMAAAAVPVIPAAATVPTPSMDSGEPSVPGRWVFVSETESTQGESAAATGGEMMMGRRPASPTRGTSSGGGSVGGRPQKRLMLPRPASAASRGPRPPSRSTTPRRRGYETYM